MAQGDKQNGRYDKERASNVLSGLTLAALLSGLVFFYNVVRDIRNDLIRVIEKHEVRPGHGRVREDIAELKYRVQNLEGRQ